MKLHLPIGLRKALLAVFAVVAPATVAVTVASASALAEGVATISDLPDSVIAVVGDKVSTYNNDVAQKAYEDAYDAAENTTAYTEAYNAAFSSTREEVSKQYAADAQTKAQNSAEYKTVGSNAYTNAWNEKESERLAAQQLAENAKRTEIYAAAYAEALKEDISLSNLGSYYARYEELYEQYKKDGLKWYQASAKALETVGNEIAEDKAEAAVATEKSQAEITAAGTTAYNEYGKSYAEDARDAAQSQYLEGIYNTEYDRAFKAEGKTAGEAAGLAAGAGVQDAAGKEAVNNAAYVYSTTYGSEKVTYKDKNGNTVTVDLHTNKADFTEFGLDNKSSEKTDIAKMELQNGNLVLDKESYYDVAIGEETTNDVAHGEDHAHNVVNNAEVQYRIHDYELDETIDLEEGSVITTNPANSITIGTEDAAGGIKASTVDMDALAGITVQNGSYLTATDVDLSSESGTITVTGEGTTLQGEEVRLAGDKIVLSDGASVSTTGAATALPDGDLATYVENTTYDVTLNADTSIAITGAAEVKLPNGETTYLPTSVSGKDVLLSSTGGIEVSDGAKVAGTNSVKVDAASFTASNKADVNAIKVDISTTGDITVSESTIGTDTKSVVSLVSKDGDVNIIGDIIDPKHRTSNTQIAGKHIEIAGKNVIWDGGKIRTSADGSSFSMTAEEKLLIMDGADMYARGSALFQGGDIVMSGAYLNLQHAVTDLVATSGNIVLNGNPTAEDFAAYGITPHDGWYTATYILSTKAITLTANNGGIALKKAYIECSNDVTTLTAGGAISLTEGAHIKGRAITLIGDSLLLSGKDTYLNASGYDEKNIPGNLTLTFENGITISDGAKVSADRNISMTTTNGDISISGATANLVTEKGFVNLSAGNSINLTGVTTSGKTGVSMTATNGSITSNGGIASTDGSVVLGAGQDLNLTGVTTSGKTGVSLTATNGSITTDGDITSTDGSVVLNAGQNLNLTGAATSGKGNVSLTATKGSITTDGDITSTDGSVVLNAGQNLNLTGAATSGKTGVSLTATNGSISADGNITSSEGAVVLSSGKALSLNGVTVSGKTGVSLTSTNGGITTNGNIGSEKGSVILDSNGAIALNTGSVISAGADVKLTSSSPLVSNTITGSTINAGGEFSMVGGVYDGLFIDHPTSGFHSITDSTITAGSLVNMVGLTNTINGTVTDSVSTTNVSGNVVTLGSAGATLYNDINGGFVTSTTGDIVLNAMANNVQGSSVLTSKQGSITLNGSTVENLDGLLKLVGSFIPDLPDITANMVSGTLNAGQKVSMDATGNLLTGGTVQGGTGVALNGAINALTGSNVIATNGDIDVIADEGVGGTLLKAALELAEENGVKLGDLGEWTSVLEGLTGDNGINLMTAGSLTADNGYVTMDGLANVMTGGTVNAGELVTLDGAINAVTGGSLTGSSVAMQASEGKSLNIGGIISSLLKQDQEGESGEGTEGDSALGSGDSTISDLLANLDTTLLEGNANLLIGSVDENGVYSTNVTATGGDVTLDGKLNVLVGSSVNAQAGSVNLDGTANVLVNGSIAAGNTVTLDGAINAVSGNITGGSVEFVAGEDKELNLGGLISSMLGSKDTEGELNPDGELGEQLPDGVQPDAEKDNGLADLLDNLDTLTLAGNVNLMMGGTVEATTGNVLMDGTANIMTAGTVKAKDTVALNGTINAVIDGTVSGGNVEFKATENSSLDLGGILSGLIGSNETEEGDGESSDNMFSDLIENLGDDVLKGNINLVTGGDVDATTGNVSMDGTLNLLTGGTVSAANGAVTLNGTANVLAGGTVNNSQNVELKGAVNAVTGGLVEGDSVTFGAAENGLAVGEMLGSLLESAQIEGLEGVSDMLAGLNLNGNANLVTGGTVNATEGDVTLNGTINLTTGGMVSTTTGDVLVNGSLNIVTGGSMDAADQLTLNGPANIVTGGTLSGGSVELKGDDMPLGSLVGGLLDGVLEGVELPEELNGLVSGSVTDVLNNLTGNFNVVTGDEAVIAADSTASLTGTVNYVGDGATVAGTDVTLKGAANVVLNGATLEADDALTLTGTGAGISLGSFITIPEEYKEYADQLGLTALLNKEASANVVMGNETSLVGKTVELSAMVNMLSDRAMVTGGEVALNGNLNIVTDGVNIETTSEDISLVGDLNLVTHIVLDDLMNAIQNGTALPTDNGEYTTLLESAGDINLIGAANAVHGDVVLNAKGDVLMEGSGQPLFNTDSLNLQQVVDLAAKLGAGELLGTAKDEALNLIKDYINSNDLSGLKEIAQQLGAEDIINGTLADAKGSLLDFIAQHAEAKLPQLDLTGNVNVVSTGAYVHGANVTMNGTANLVTDGAKIEADGAVSMNGMANIVAGGSTVSGTDVSMSGGMNVIVDTTLDNVKDAITNGSLDSIATGGTTQTTIAAKDELVLDATANLVNGYVSLSSDNSVTMEGITNVVAGEAEVQGANSVEMDGVLNVVAGGATVGSSAGDITMGGGMNMIVDTSLENVVDALQQQSLAPLMQGGSVDTTLTAASDITLNATVNAVNGGQVTLDAGDTMKMSGAVNVVSGNATLKGEDIVMAGDKSVAVDLNTLLPAEWADKAAELGLSDMLEGGLSLNAVAGGANLIAEDDITMRGIASVVVDTSMGNIMEALATQSIDPLIKGGTSETNLEANNINMLSKLNVVSGGKVRLDAENNVKMDGVANMVHGNTVVEAGNTISVSGAANVVAGGATLDAKNIKMTGKGSISADLEGLLPADWAEKAAELGLTDVLEKGVNVNAVAGGANLLADEDITMGGMATFVVDTTVENVVDALKQMSIDPLLQGGTTETVLSAEREIHMNSLVNVVSGGKVTVEAGRNVNMSGVANVVNGNAVVDAGETIYMFGAANVVSGGADLTADYIEMTGNGSINGKIAGVLESVLPGVDLPTNGSVNAILGEGTSLDADKVALSGALNVVDGATVSGDDSVLMNGNVNMLSNNAQVVSENGNITINGGAGVQSVTTMENASLTAEKGKVVFNNALVGSTDSTVTAGLGMTVKGNSSVQLNDVLLGGETLVSADSDLEIDGMLRTNDGTFIENMGSLQLNDVALSAGSELFNGGVIQIDGDLSLDSAKLTFVIESLTNNDTAITLGANANITAADITNVTFVIESDKVASALYNYEEFSFVLFENASAEDFSLVEAALAQNEITFTINGATWSDFNDELEVRHEGGNIVIMGNVVIPEPTTATLSLLALAALAARRRRK